MKPWDRYADDVLSGRIPACLHVRQACERFVRDKAREDLVFREDRVDRAMDFIRLLKHHDGSPEIVGKNLELSDWQAFVVANIHGFWYRESGARRFTNCYIEVARKCAKTQLMAALGLYALFEYESANQILLTANSREQAHRLFDFVKAFGAQLDPTRKSLKLNRDKIEFKETGGYVLVLSSDHKSSDGFQPYFAVCDEVHQARNAEGINVLRSGMTKKNSFLALITTSGFNKSGICYEFRTLSVDILAGRKDDDRMFALVYTLDPEDDWRDENVWIKACPNIGKSAPWEFYRDSYNAARNSPIQQENFKVKNLNLWSETREIWIPPAIFDKCRAKVDPADFRGEFCYMGADLGAVHDITAVSYLFRRDGKFYLYNDYYLPADCLDDGGENADFYRRMRREGRLRITDGNVTDYDAVQRDILARQRECGFTIHTLGYDSYNATQFAVNMVSAGVRMLPVSQSLGGMNKGTKEFERLVYTGGITVDDNPVTAWMIANCVLKQDWNGNVKPNKAVTVNGSNVQFRKIDGVISAITALIVCIEKGPRWRSDDGSDD